MCHIVIKLQKLRIGGFGQIADAFNLEGVENEVISVYDATGRLVMQQVYNYNLDVSGLAKGVYAVKTQKGIVKFVKV